MKLTRRHFLAAGTAVLAGGAGYALRSNALEAVPTATPGPRHRPALRVAFATDMHAPHDFVDPDDMARLARGFDPHLVLIGGDSIDRKGNERLLAAYAGLEARLGKFAVLGNWERWCQCDLATLRREYARAGVRLLINERVTIDLDGEPIDLVGLDDHVGGVANYGMLQQAPDGDATDSSRRVVLAHCPVAFDQIVRASAPCVVLSGHTHGGQLAPFGRAMYTPFGSGPYVSGWYAGPSARHHMYVSRGLGNSVVPFRLGCRPELTLLTL